MVSGHHAVLVCNSQISAMIAATDLSFSTPGLRAHLARLSTEDLDRLDFGVIGFDIETTARQYNRAEPEAAALAPARVLGQPLCTNVAPCLSHLVGARRVEGAAPAAWSATACRSTCCPRVWARARAARPRCCR